MGKLKEIWSNKWVKFAVVSVIYILLAVVWTGNLWMLLGLIVIFDIYISKYMYRLFWGRHKRLMKENKTYRLVMGWVEAIVFALVVVTLLKYFVFGMYVIPSSSMEKSLLVGDYLWVSKLAYGPMVPNTPLSFPLVHNTMPLSQTKKSYSEAIKWPYHRLKGFGHVKRGDVVVFHFPAGDTVVQERINETYYDILRYYQAQYGTDHGREKLYSEYTIVTHPVDKRENFVKRCVGIPGDTIKISATELLVNGEPLEGIPGLQFAYYVQTNGTPISQKTFSDLGISYSDVYSVQPNMYYVPLTDENAKKIAAMRNVVGVVKQIADEVNVNIFPHDPSLYPWNEDNYGPLWVPKKGTTVQLTPQTLPFYRDIIQKYEANTLEEKDGQIIINGVPADSYTFKMDYYFMMGDNRHFSADSRYWGFVPEDHIVGKPRFVLISFDRERSFPENIRWNRLFRWVKGAETK